MKSGNLCDVLKNLGQSRRRVSFKLWTPRTLPAIAATYNASSVNALNQNVVEIFKPRPLTNTKKAKQEPLCQGYLV